MEDILTLFSSHLYSTEIMPNTAVTDIAVIQLWRLQNIVCHGRCGVSCTQITQMLNLTLCASDILFFPEVTCNLGNFFSLKRALCIFPVSRDQYVTWYPSGSSPSTGRKRSRLCSTLSTLWQVLMALRRLHPASSHGPRGSVQIQVCAPVILPALPLPCGLPSRLSLAPALSADMSQPLAAHCHWGPTGVVVGPPIHLWKQTKNCFKSAVSAVWGSFDF